MISGANGLDCTVRLLITRRRMKRIKDWGRSGRFAVTLFVLSGTHVVLWAIWELYRYGFLIRLPDWMIAVGMAVVKPTQLEQLPEVVKATVLLFGFVFAFLIAVGVAAIGGSTKPARTSM